MFLFLKTTYCSFNIVIIKLITTSILMMMMIMMVAILDLVDYFNISETFNNSKK